MTQEKYKKALELRNAGMSVLAACRKAKLPVPTFYYQLKKAGTNGIRVQGAKTKFIQVAKPALTGFELRRLRTASARIKKLSHEVELLLSKI